mgnify:FL=1
MKLLTLTVVREFEKDVKKLLLHSGVNAFTFMPVKGYKDVSAESLDDNWFATEVNETDSLLFWAFVPAENVPKVEVAIQHFNAKQESLSRIPLSILNIEKTI